MLSLGISADHPHPAIKRAYDLVFAVTGLVITSPLMALATLLIKIEDRGPSLFRQRRVGQHGRPFLILKFRTMAVDAEMRGPKLTCNSDARITRVGRLLRRTKLDELPQLWNVVRGEMSLVGPRPELPRYVEKYTPEQRRVLAFKPGMTDLASIEFRDEEALFPPGEDPEEFYLAHCLPRKLALSLDHASRGSLWLDTCVILQTLFPLRVSRPGGNERTSVRH